MILVCGEALIDLAPVERDGEELWRAAAGGGPRNAAVALARLGVPVAFVGRLSTDAFGQRLRAGLDGAGVDLRHVVTGDEPTSMAVITVDGHGTPSFGFLREGTADRLLRPADLPTDFTGVEALHVGSLGLLDEPQASTLTGLMQRRAGHTFQYCDPNPRPFLIADRVGYLARVRRWSGWVDVVKFSDDDLAWLLPGTDPLLEAERWARDHEVLVVLTRGAAGADAFWPGGHCRVGAVPVTVADTVGAGDSFGAGFLAELRRHGPLRPGALRTVGAGVVAAALAHGARAAAVTCSRPGADPPWAREL